LIFAGVNTYFFAGKGEKGPEICEKKKKISRREHVQKKRWGKSRRWSMGKTKKRDKKLRPVENQLKIRLEKVS